MSIVAAVVAALPSVSSMAVSSVGANSGVALEFLGRADKGTGNMGSEITAYDPESQRIFVTNGYANKVDIFSIGNPSVPTYVDSISFGSLDVTGVQSVASKNGLIAVATSVSPNNQAPGKVFVFDAEGKIDSRAPQGITVGSLPDSVHFTPDGTAILVANEGEPKDYCLVNGSLPTTSDPVGSVSIIDTTVKGTLTAVTLDFSRFDTNAAEIRAAGGRIYGPGASVAQDLEPEYIGISPDSTTAYVTLQENNAVAVVDIKNKSISRILGLGYKDHSVNGNALDPSDQDSAANGGVNIANWAVKGMFQPDNIQSFTGSDGATYFITANEGDAREYRCLLGGSSSGSVEAEDARVSSVGVDGTNLASTLSATTALGRLGVTRFEPATYTNNGTPRTAVATTDFTSLYTLGARSISIWKAPSSTNAVAAATLVSDTGDLIEKKIAELLPTYFNADWNTGTGVPNAKDSRSDNKGPEPEGIAVGRAFGRTLAFVGLERIGGVMTFDISNPATPTFLDYLNTSTFTGVGGPNFGTGGARAGDVSPEGVLFISATDSPINAPLLVVSHELSGTTAIYKVKGTPTAPSSPTSPRVKMSGTTATISWSPPAEDGGARVSSYVVTTSGGKKCIARGVEECSILGLTNGLSYSFSVVARNSAGASKGAVTGRLTAGIDPTVASNVITTTKGRSVTVRVIAPALTKPAKYAIQLRDATGALASRIVTITQASRGVTLTSPKSGSVTVVVVALAKSGAKNVWNGPNLTISR